MPHPFRPVVESLESRTLMAATVTGTRLLTITADDTATTVVVTAINTRRFSLTVDGGAPQEYTFKAVSRIKFFGGAGDDVFRAVSLPRDPAAGRSRSILFTERTSLVGGAGNDLLVDSYAGSRINGGDGNDTIVGGGGSDLVIGGAGDDLITAGTTSDDPIQRDSADIVFGSSGNDTINGGSGKDVLFGQAGNDQLLGSFDRDALFGNEGDDTLEGGPGRDILYAGGQTGDIFTNAREEDRVSRGEVRDVRTYFSRIIRAYLPDSLRPDARA